MADIDRIVVIHDYSHAEGGAGMLAMGAIRGYCARGYPVTLITGQGPTDELAALGVEVCGLGSAGLLERSALAAMKDGLHNAAAKAMITDWIAQNDTPHTVYHLNNWAQIYPALRPVADRTIVTCHDFFNVCPNGSFLHFGTSKTCEVKPLSAACFFKQCDRRNPIHKYWRFARHVHLNQLADFANSPSTFSFIHEEMRAKFRRAGFKAEDLVVTPNPVTAWSGERIRAEENESFLFVGRVGRDKGADLAMQATAEAGQPITIVGKGELEDEARANHPHAMLTGWLTPEEIAGHARKARALIVPSRVTEPFGLVILEAAMSGLPVIVSDSAYLSGDVERLGFGRRVSMSQPGALTGAVQALAGDDALVREMSERAFDVASSLCHSAESWIEAHLDIFARKLATARVTGGAQERAGRTAATSHG